jgi:hypothetical protein
MLIEASSANILLNIFNSRVKRAKSEDEWFIGVRTLGVENGPLDQLKAALQILVSKLKPVEGLKKAGKLLTWSFDKKDIVTTLSKMERVKSQINLALTNDLL